MLILSLSINSISDRSFTRCQDVSSFGSHFTPLEEVSCEHRDSCRPYTNWCRGHSITLMLQVQHVGLRMSWLLLLTWVYLNLLLYLRSRVALFQSVSFPVLHCFTRNSWRKLREESNWVLWSKILGLKVFLDQLGSSHLSRSYPTLAATFTALMCIQNVVSKHNFSACIVIRIWGHSRVSSRLQTWGRCL